MAFLVTGAAGFVGLNVTEHLLAEGHQVVATDRIPIPPPARAAFAALPGHLVPLSGSILSAADLKAAFAAAPVDAVIHCAVITAGTEREARDPEGIVSTNVGGAVATLAEATRAGVRRFVYPSSVAVYGTAALGVDPVPESLPPAPVMIYGATKLACELLLPRIAAVGGTRFAAARLASVFGPWEYGTGARDTLSPMLSALTLALAGGEAVLNQPGLGDFCYSRDIAAGLVALAAAPSLSRTIYNLGSGRASSAEDWCRALAAERPAFRWRRAAEGETPNTVSHVTFDRGGLDLTAIEADTAYRPRFSLEAAARDYLAWRASTPG